FHFFRGPEKAEHLGVSFLCEYVSGEIALNDKEQIAYKWTTPKAALSLIKDISIINSIHKLEEII
ncbi:MAG: hypothetical protein ABIJ38_01765, partial [Patescibacteria group bacterium]